MYDFANDSAVQSFLKQADDFREKLIANGHFFWEHPELGYREKETSAYAIKLLKEAGYKVQDNLSLTGFRADLDTGRPGPTVALFGEMDALNIPTHPENKNGAVHACGHHTHINAMLGVALLLPKSELLKRMCGKIAFIGAPCEEGIDLKLASSLIQEGKVRAISGKVSMYKQGILDDVDLAFMNHCGINAQCRLNAGNMKKHVVFHGKSCHAAWPTMGINAMSAMTLAQCAIGLLREKLPDAVRIHGIITEGGKAANVIPELTAMDYYVRGSSVDEILNACKLFDDAVRYSAKALGAEAEITTIYGSLPIVPAPELGRVHGEVSGFLIPDAKGIGIFKTRPGCSDMGDMAYIMPALHGSLPGLCGTGHGSDARTPDDNLAYVVPVKHAGLMLYLLLKDEAASAKAAMREFGPKRTHEEYDNLEKRFIGGEE